jgi:ubiquinol-cytochrome c reductase cytochrome b subunit
MKPLIRHLLDWTDKRTGLETAVRHFLLEEVPASAGWAQVFGSVALFLFMIQAFTGILLSFNFAGTPGEAYNSVSYIVREVTAGGMIRGLHHWGASLMIIVIVVHATQVFLYGAYKKPREATWMTGVVLFLFTIAFGLTGYLLPWDNKAYWGTVVTAKIMGGAPVLGAYLQRLIGAEDGIGVVTFARFYSLHTLLLPVAMIAFVGIHVMLVRRHGVTPSVLAEKRPAQTFYPQQAFRDVVAVFITFTILFTAALLLKVPLERLADPTDASYIPRPEWYFLFLFQSLKFFKGSLEPVGSILLPTLAVIVLFAIPFIDRGRVCLVRQRTVAIAAVILLFAGWTALTAAAVRTSPKIVAAQTSDLILSGSAEFSPEETAGLGYFRQERCDSCHNLIDGDPKIGPNLAGEGRRRSADWMIQHFKNPSQMVPGSNMPPIQLSLVELNALSAFLLKLTPEKSRNLSDIPQFYVEGAQIYVTSLCGSCHKLNDSGGEIGPSLNGLATRRSKDWVKKHFVSPRTLSPGSTMPPYHFSPAQEEALVEYLFAIP